MEWYEITWQRKRMLMFYGSLTIGGAIALFWTIFRLIAGYIPVVTTIEVFALKLPFGVSRWWDILMGLTWPIIGVLFFTSTRVLRIVDENVDSGAAGLQALLAAFFVLSLIAGLFGGSPTALLGLLVCISIVAFVLVFIAALAITAGLLGTALWLMCMVVEFVFSRGPDVEQKNGQLSNRPRSISGHKGP